MAVDIEALLGDEASSLLGHTCTTIEKERILAPSGTWVSDALRDSDRPTNVLVNLQRLLDNGRLGGTGYTSILPVDQGIEHSAGASFAPNPDYFDPEHIVTLAIEAGCNGVASTYGVMASMARRYAHRIPFILKFNHNELLTHPNTFDQVFFAQIEQAFDAGCCAVGATIYFGSDESSRQIQEVAQAFEPGPRAGDGHHPLVLPPQQRLQDRRRGLPHGGRPHVAGDSHRRDDRRGHREAEAPDRERRVQGAELGRQLLRQARRAHLHRADERQPDRPRALPGRQRLHGPRRPDQLGRSVGDNDLAQAVRTAVINKRGGGMGLISGRKAFQKPLNEGVAA